MSFDNIIFDFDHTLVEFGPHVDWRNAVREIEAIYLDEGISPAIVDQSKGRGFKMMRSVYDHMLEGFSRKRREEIQSRVFAALDVYELVGVDRASMMNGAPEILSWLRSTRRQCAIVTSNGTRPVELALQRLGITDFFAGVFGRAASCRLKPYPDQNQACLNSLGWRPEQTMLVGDSADDILSAKALSIFAVGVVSGLAKREALIEAGADCIAGSLAELPSALQR